MGRESPGGLWSRKGRGAEVGRESPRGLWSHEGGVAEVDRRSSDYGVPTGDYRCRVPLLQCYLLSSLAL